jgi:hypothetical protein
MCCEASDTAGCKLRYSLRLSCVPSGWCFFFFQNSIYTGWQESFKCCHVITNLKWHKWCSCSWHLIYPVTDDVTSAVAGLQWYMCGVVMQTGSPSAGREWSISHTFVALERKGAVARDLCLISHVAGSATDETGCITRQEMYALRNIYDAFSLLLPIDFQLWILGLLVTVTWWQAIVQIVPCTAAILWSIVRSYLSYNHSWVIHQNSQANTSWDN